MSDKRPNPNYVPPASVRKPINLQGHASEYITISVAEYHVLTKAAAMLEVVLNAKAYNRDAVVDAVRATIYGAPEEGAAE